MLSGCGSSSPPIAVSCTTHALSTRLIQARVTVRNTTGSSHRAYVYGPALTRVRRVQPVLRSASVVVRVAHSARSYPGWIVPRVDPNKTAHLLFRLVKPARPASIVAGTKPIVHDESWDALKNGDCTIGA